MPFITFESGQLSDETKRELIQKLTTISADITGIPKESFFVAIRELPDDNIAIGGVTVKEFKEKQGKK
jgi:4-oxalocrotonate tautomerase